MKKLFLCIICILCFNIAYSDNKITKVWIDHGVTENGEKGMKIFLNLSVSYLKGEKITCYALFKDKNGSFLKDINGKYAMNGYVCFHSNHTPNYTHTSFTNISIFCPYSELHLHNGKSDYKCIIRVKAKGEYILEDSSLTFSGTGNTPQKPQEQNHNPNYDPSKWKQYSKVYLDNGGYIEYKTTPNGTSISIWHLKCTVCNGNRICNTCGGTGRIINGWGTFSPCWCATQVAGNCWNCRGEGYTTSTTTIDKNGLVVGWDQNGNCLISVVGEKGNKTDQTIVVPQGKRICPGCKGRKYSHSTIDPGPEYVAGREYWCDICNEYGSNHIHNKHQCRVCYGKGYVE